MFYRETNFQDLPIGKIPKDWDFVKLGDTLSLLRNGLTAKQNKEANGYPVTRIETISEETINPNKFGYLPEVSERDLIEFRLTEGDILFSHINSLKHIGKTALYEGIPELLLHGMNLLLLRPNNTRVDPKYLLYLLKLFRIRGIFRAIAKKAVNQASINQTELGRVRISLPPMEEQHKIVEALSVIDFAIGKVDEVIAKTERLKKGLLQQLLTKGIGHKEFKDTKIGKTPKEWQVLTMGEICKVGTGGTPSRKHPEYFDGDIPWVKSTEINYSIITETEEHITKLGLQNSNVQIYPIGTLLIAMYGQGITRARCGILGVNAAINQACASVIPKKADSIHLPYLYYWSQYKYEEIRNFGQGANQPNLNLSLVRLIRVALPSLSEQQEIAEILSTIDRKLELEKKEKVRLERIKRGLMDLLLTGKVRVKVAD